MNCIAPISTVTSWSGNQEPSAWYSSSGWYRRIANQTHWAFDGIPNERAGNFPG